MQLIIKAKKVVTILTIIVLFLTAASFATQYYKYYIGHDRYIVKFFDLDSEWNLPTLYASITLLLCAQLLMLIARSKKRKKKEFYLHWQLLSIAFLYLAIDEAIKLHEMTIMPIRDMFDLTGIFYYSWVIPAGCLLVLFAIIYFKFFMSLSPKFKLLFFISCLIYVGGALGMELASGYYASSYGINNFTYSIIANIEEVFEMVGVIVFIYTLLLYISIDLRKIELSVIISKKNNHRIYEE